MKKQTKRKRRNTKNRHLYKRRNIHKTQKNHKKRNHHNVRHLRKFIPDTQGQEARLFSIPKKQQSFKIMTDNNHKQFGNIIPGLREM